MDKSCIVIVGPTAVGKTPFAIEIARHYGTDIISADSRQCYRELNIGVAKPSSKDLQQVKHYFINSHSIHDEVNAKLFEEYALESVYDIFASHDVAVVVGGTGLYVKAFCEGLDPVPEVDPRIRKRIVSSFKENGLSWLQKEIEQQDPVFFSTGEIQNPQRIMRALEVKLSTGRSVVEFHQQRKKRRDFKILKAGLKLTKEQLHENINNRVTRMMDEGLLDEVKGLYPFKNINALQTVGYTELFDHLEGKISLDEAMEQIKTHTRQYAKRQMTWFNSDKEIVWMAEQDARYWMRMLDIRS